jgi:hypothetical protein
MSSISSYLNNLIDVPFKLASVNSAVNKLYGFGDVSRCTVIKTLDFKFCLLVL